VKLSTFGERALHPYGLLNLGSRAGGDVKTWKMTPGNECDRRKEEKEQAKRLDFMLGILPHSYPSKSQ
jgi:hypothetical protein